MTTEPVGHSPRSINVPGNPLKSRVEPPTASQPEPVDKIEKIIDGNAVLRKQPWYKRAARSMIADDATSVGDYIMTDVFIPAVKNLIFEIITGGASRTLYGNARGRRGIREGGSLSGFRTRYDQMAEAGPTSRRSISPEARRRHDFGEVILPSREEAIDVIETLQERIVKYGKTSVQDLYDALGVTGDYAALYWGWTDLTHANARLYRGNWLLDLPEPESLR